MASSFFDFTADKRIFGKSSNGVIKTRAKCCNLLTFWDKASLNSTPIFTRFSSNFKPLTFWNTREIESFLFIIVELWWFFYEVKMHSDRGTSLKGLDQICDANSLTFTSFFCREAQDEVINIDSLAHWLVTCQIL